MLISNQNKPLNRKKTEPNQPETNQTNKALKLTNPKTNQQSQTEINQTGHIHTNKFKQTSENKPGQPKEINKTNTFKLNRIAINPNQQNHQQL